MTERVARSMKRTCVEGIAASKGSRVSQRGEVRRKSLSTCILGAVVRTGV